MNHFKVFIISLVFITSILCAQEIPINDLLYSITDFEFTLAPSGKYMASIKKFPNGYSILITDIKAAAVKFSIPLGDIRVSNLNWISENRVSYEQLGVLYAINIDRTENQQLMSILKDEDRVYFSTYSLLKNI